MLDSLSEADVIEHVKKDGGIELNFVDYPHHHSTLLKLDEIRSVQIFVPHLRGDQRPLVQLRSCRGEDHYWKELPDRLDDVKDDVIQMLELRLTFERRKTEIAK